MLRSLLAITTNTFTETVRQPIYGVVIGITILLLIFSPSLAMFTMDDDNQLLRDIGLSTLLVSGLFLGVFAAASVVTEEIENKTVLTVLSKTVGRGTFILGKFMGISVAVLLAEYLLSVILLMVVRHGVLQTARDNPDTVVITLGAIAAMLTLLVGLAGNYFYRWRFTSTAIILGTVLASIVIGLLAFIDPDWRYNPAANHLRWDMIRPIILTTIAVLILSSIAITAATRLNLIMTLVVCSTVFVLGVMLQHWLGPIAVSTGWASYLAWIPLAIVPCINFYVVTNAIYQGIAVPFSYIGQVAAYALLYVSAALLFAIALFRSRELG